MNQQNGNLANGQQTPGQPMNSKVPQNGDPESSWRESIDSIDRAHFVAGISHALKHLSPTASESSIHDAVKKFENSAFLTSKSRNQYIVTYARKLHQIRSQTLMRNESSFNGSNGMMYDAQHQNLQFGVPQRTREAHTQGRQPSSVVSPQVQSVPQHPQQQAYTSNVNISQPSQH